MKETLPLNKFIEIIVRHTGHISADVEKVLGEYISLLSERLATTGTISIEGIGDLSVSYIGERKILLRPDEQLAQKLNEPFDIFEPVEIDPDFPIELLNTKADNNALEIIENSGTDENVTDESNISSTVSDPEYAQEQLNIGHDGNRTDVGSEDSTNAEIHVDEQAQAEYAPSITPKTGANYWSRQILWLIIGLLAGFIAGLMLHDPINTAFDTADSKPIKTIFDSVYKSPHSSHHVTEEQLPAVERQTEPASEIIVETVKSGYDITHMAKKHYGSKLFWVYIYDANPDLPRNPNHIQPGMNVIIPSVSSLEVDLNSPETIASARKRASEIYGSLQ